MAADNGLAVFLQKTRAANGNPIRLPHRIIDEDNRVWDHPGYVAWTCPGCGEETLEAAGMKSPDCGREGCRGNQRSR